MEPIDRALRGLLKEAHPARPAKCAGKGVFDG